MKIRKILAILTVFVILLACCACSNSDPIPSTDSPDTTPPETTVPELTAAEVAQQMEQAIARTPASKLNMVMDMQINMLIEGMDPIEMSMKTITEMTVSQDPVSSYALATADISLAGETGTTTTETYTVLENDEVVSYVCSEGIWVKVPTGLTSDMFTASNSVTFDPTNVTLDDTISTWNNQAILCLKTQITGDLVEKALGDTLNGIRENGGTLGSSAEALEMIDYTKLTCDCTIYLDPETYLPVEQEMSIKGMNEVMAPLYESLGVDIDVTNCVSTVNFLSYDTQPAITVPEDIAQAAEAWTRLLANEPDNGDGTFTIREGGVLIDLVHPEGFEVVEKDYDHVTFQREDYRQITYIMYYLDGSDTTGAVFAEENNKSAERWATNGGQVSREQQNLSTDTLAFLCDLLTTKWESGRKDANFYGWTALAYDEAGTYYLFVEVLDGYDDGMGNSKTADITPDEFLAYLSAASPSQLTAE